MRYLYAFAALLSAALFSGCQSCTTPAVPIVGDSMSRWSSAEASCSTLPPTVAVSRSNDACSNCNRQGCGGACLREAMSRLAAARGARVDSGIYNDFGTADCLGCGCDCGMDNCGMDNCGSGACGGGGRIGQAMPGCGGNVCNGRCGGRCRIAQMREMTRALAQQNKLVNYARRHCAYGACGGSLGPQQGQVTFPYYTVRGPRDFLNPNPPSIGP